MDTEDFGSVDPAGDSQFFANAQGFDDVISGNDSATYDSLSSFQGFDDVLTDNQGYGWDTTDNWGGAIWATGDPSVDSTNFGY